MTFRDEWALNTKNQSFFPIMQSVQLSSVQSLDRLGRRDGGGVGGGGGGEKGT